MKRQELEQQDLEIISDEENRYKTVFAEIQSHVSTKAKELEQDEKLSRELTAEMVRTRNDEEKQFLHSDEAVAHRLVNMRLKQSDSLAELIKQPYFARVVYHEKGRDVEFKLGVASFPEQRIIDWRKAPISQLYYDYEEGEEYDDEIAGIERNGVIKLKRAFRGKRDILASIDLKDVSYQKYKGEWRKQRKELQEPFSLEDKEKIKKLLSEPQDAHWDELEDGYLTQILSLLSPDQFQLISSDLSHPVIVQGSAGTGKTTVALHRLAWLLFEGNSQAKAENCLVIMPNPVLVEYVKEILPSLGIQGVAIATYEDWKANRGKTLPLNLDHLLIDEAQDFNLSEIQDMFSFLRDKTQLTIAGDLGQKIFSYRGFDSWHELLENLGFDDVDVLNLSIAYRSTYQIYELAEHIRDPDIKDEDLKLHPKFGPEPHMTVAHNFNEALELTKTWVEDIISINQKTIGAIVCRSHKEARQLFEALLKNGVHGVRFGDSQHFEFTPGITVTDVAQVKGLEFQALLIFNPSEKSYPKTYGEDRNLLYVAVTRAIHKLDVICYEKPTPMIPDFISCLDLTLVEEDLEADRDQDRHGKKDVYDLVVTKEELFAEDSSPENAKPFEENLGEKLIENEDAFNPDDELGIFDDHDDEDDS